MKLFWRAAAIVTLSGISAGAQLNIVNPDDMAISQVPAEILRQPAPRAVTEQFHVHNHAQIESPITLQIGDAEVDRSHIDENNQYVHRAYVPLG
jgi:hypothetical protein